MCQRWKSRSNVGQPQWAPKSVSCIHSVLSSNKLWGGFPGRAVPGFLSWYQQVVVAVRNMKAADSKKRTGPTHSLKSFSQAGILVGKYDGKINFLLLTPDAVEQQSHLQETVARYCHTLTTEWDVSSKMAGSLLTPWKAFDMNTTFILCVMMNPGIKPKNTK